jgi:hypothetical protein
MTGVAVDTFVGPDQGQSGGIVVAAHLRPVNPAIRGVAILADGTQPTAMKVLMTVHTGRAHVGKHRFLMAIPTLGVRVETFEVEPGDRMVEVLHPTLFIP